MKTRLFKASIALGLLLAGLLCAASSALAAAPELTANSLRIAKGESVILSVAHIDAADSDTAFAALTFNATGVAGGRIERTSGPGAAITTFSGAEVANRALRFVHNDSMTPAAYTLTVSDGTSTSAAVAADVTFSHGHAHAPMADMAAALALVADANATHTAVASGAWSDSNVWGGSVPGAGARIVIPASIAVVVDTVLAPEFESMRVDGMLRFATNATTALRIDTLVANMGSRFEVGTSQIPVASGAMTTVTFIDDGNINTNEDFAQIGRGAILAGETVIHGDATTSHVALAVHPTAGTNQLSLETTPTGWDIGDELIITGTVVNDPESDEIRTITGISGTTVFLNQPLSLNHTAPRPDLNVYVANATRNIVFQSETTTIRRRGHIMWPHTLDVDVRYARFYRLGRTDKTRSLDDVFFEFGEGVGNEGSAPIDFTTETGPRTNIRGRYPIHLHRGGVDPTSSPALIEGCVVYDGPGWGFVTHSSNAIFRHNVSYAIQGTGFYTEAGDEIGLMESNIAIRTVNSAFQFDSSNGAIDPDLGFDNQEFGNDGDGYWLSGNMVAMRNNVSAGSSAHGFIYWTDGLVEADIPRGRATVRVADVANGHLIPGRETIPVWWAPLAENSGNEAYNSVVGFRARYIHAQVYMGEGGSAFHERPPQAYIDSLDPRIDNLTVWNNRDGVLLNYTARMSVYNSLIVGIGTPFFLDPGTMNTGPGLDMGTEVTAGMGRIENVTIEGFDMGFVMPRSHHWTMEDLTLRNTTDMLLTEARLGPRALTMNDITFGPLAGTAVAGNEGQRRNISAEPDYGPAGYQPYWFAMPDRITLDDQGIFFNSQAPSFVPLQENPNGEESLINIPNGYVRTSNQNMFNRYGVSTSHAFPPNDATTVPWLVGGTVGTPAPAAVTFPLLLDMTNEGGSPEPPPGGPTPELTGNRLEIRRGTTRTLTAVNLNTTDTNTEIPNLVYTVSNVTGGYFARRGAATTPIATFNHAEIAGGWIRFVHDGGCSAPQFDTRVTDGQTTTAASAAITNLVIPPGDTGCGGPTTTTTTTTTMGNGTTTTTTTTMPGPTTTTTTTTSTTTTLPPGTCGNGIVENGEDCDPMGADPCCTAGCQFAPTTTSCDDGSVCTGSDSCNAFGVCEGMPVFCDDGNPCTIEMCDPASGCPQSGLAEPRPEDDCKYADKIGLKILDKPGVDKDRFSFIWRTGEEASEAEVGDFAANGIDLCIFDTENSNPVLATWMSVPGGPEWERRPEDTGDELVGYRYKGANGIDGIDKVKFRVGPEDRASFLIKGKGSRLQLPAPYSADEYFAVNDQVVVEVHSNTGACWQAVFEEPKKNRGSDFNVPQYKE